MEQHYVWLLNYTVHGLFAVIAVLMIASFVLRLQIRECKETDEWWSCAFLLSYTILFALHAAHFIWPDAHVHGVSTGWQHYSNEAWILMAALIIGLLGAVCLLQTRGRGRYG